MMQSIRTHFRLSAKDTDKQVMLHVLTKSWNAQIRLSGVSDV